MNGQTKYAMGVDQELIVLFDQKMRVLFINSLFMESFGYSMYEVYRKNISMLFVNSYALANDGNDDFMEGVLGITHNLQGVAKKMGWP